MSIDIPFTRRRFLAAAGAAGAAVGGGALLDWALDGGPGTPAAASVTSNGPLVVITLYGGNDGLNTVVPYEDPRYRAARPTLGYTPSEVLDLGDGLGLNPRLGGLHGLWRTGKLAIVRGVGYPNPNLSHFASMDIWQTANPVDGSGPVWLGRLLDRNPADPLLALSVGTTLPPLLRGSRRSATAITSSRIALPGGAVFQSAFEALQASGSDRSALAAAVAAAGSDLLAAKTGLDRLSVSDPAPAAGSSESRTGSAPGNGSVPAIGTAPATGTAPAAGSGPAIGSAPPAASPPAGSPSGGRRAATTGLAAQLEMVAGLIRAGSPTKVYQVSLSSFDTHSAEKANHERLLGELDSGITGFFNALGGHRAVVMTYSEFGRRPEENASGGTDHGTAAPLFVAGEGVIGGRFYGEEPSLGALDANGNLQHTVDFRSVYATVLERVLGSDSAPVLGGRFPTLPLV